MRTLLFCCLSGPLKLVLPFTGVLCIECEFLDQFQCPTIQPSASDSCFIIEKLVVPKLHRSIVEPQGVDCTTAVHRMSQHEGAQLQLHTARLAWPSKMEDLPDPTKGISTVISCRATMQGWPGTLLHEVHEILPGLPVAMWLWLAPEHPSAHTRPP